MTNAVGLSAQKTFIIIDGENVALEFGKHREFNSRGIILASLCIKRLGHPFSVVLPDECRRKDGQLAVSNDHSNGNFRWIGLENLNGLYKSDLLNFAPPGTQYKKFVAALAAQRGAFLVGTNLYENILLDTPELTKYIRNYTLKYTFVKGEFIPNPALISSDGEVVRLQKFLAQTPKPVFLCKIDNQDGFEVNKMTISTMDSKRTDDDLLAELLDLNISDQNSATAPLIQSATVGVVNQLRDGALHKMRVSTTEIFDDIRRNGSVADTSRAKADTPTSTKASTDVSAEDAEEILHEDVVEGYGYVEDLQKTCATIVPQSCPAYFLIGQLPVYCPSTAFKQDGTTSVLDLKSALGANEWVRFKAIQKSAGNFKWTATEASPACLTGLLVAYSPYFGFIYSRVAGKVYVPYNPGDNGRFSVGDWVSFNIIGQNDCNGCIWTAFNLQRAEPPSGFVVLNKHERSMTVECFGVVCSCPKTSKAGGTLWSLPFGRVSIDAQLCQEKKYSLLKCVKFVAKYDLQVASMGASDRCWKVLSAEAMDNEEQLKQLRTQMTAENLRLKVSGKIMKLLQNGCGIIDTVVGQVFSLPIDYPDGVNSFQVRQEVWVGLVPQQLHETNWRALYVVKK